MYYSAEASPTKSSRTDGNDLATPLARGYSIVNRPLTQRKLESANHLSRRCRFRNGQPSVTIFRGPRWSAIEWDAEGSGFIRDNQAMYDVWRQFVQPQMVHTCGRYVGRINKVPTVIAEELAAALARSGFRKRRLDDLSDEDRDYLAIERELGDLAQDEREATIRRPDSDQ